MEKEYQNYAWVPFKGLEWWLVFLTSLLILLVCLGTLVGQNLS